ncbi:diacylglycerol kinase [Kaistia dalseonensis]|uniref:Diacylglycerol kinase n=1 Tax=Kaistia dalseonensis TaxID=410840 RepID=A0ABU0H0E6_9HYPH|nr:diacylglycerol kinase [Kaistia dalseonensis]MCX5493226.1 diacylglycerol kinase [Kaistia dalseonensis]MDQ0435781.1 diacylglycerol kinase (ATP) [Kaistia dalseonensis]
MRHWIEHLRASLGWSISGVIILFRGEVSARMEFAAAIVCLLWLTAIGRSLAEIAVFVICAGAVLALESLNSAIELIVDDVSPQRSEFARRTKDLGSAAVFFMLTATGLYVLALSIGAFVAGV